MYTNCLREQHADRNASAIINDGSTEYMKDSVRCMGCGKWYMKDTPEKSFGSYKELVEDVNPGTHKIARIMDGELLPLPKMKSTGVRYKGKPVKSRQNYFGITSKSFLKSDNHVIGKDGNKIYLDKFPKVQPDCYGTHESVKEFFFNDVSENGTANMSKGFYNRIAIDSDETGPILPRLHKIAEISGTSGFWVILNKGNNKFQANINLTHTVINGHDLVKVREASRCINVLTGDDHMTGSFMKNHAVVDSYDPESEYGSVRNTHDFDEDHIRGAQRTRTFGYDHQMQKDFEDYMNGSVFNWINKWQKLEDEGVISIAYIDSETGKSSGEIKEGVIAFIESPAHTGFSIRKDKTWAISIEKLWSNTALKFAQVKRENGVRYEEITHSKESRNKVLTFAVATSVLKDNAKSPMTDGLLERTFALSTEKYVQYYNRNMKTYNPQVFMSGFSDSSNKLYKFEFLRTIMQNNSILRDFVSLVKAANQNGFVSLQKEDGLFDGWSRICKNSLMKECRESMEVMSREEIEVIRLVFQALVKMLASNYFKIVQGKSVSSIHTRIRPIVSTALEVSYWNCYDIIRNPGSDIVKGLNSLMLIDDELYIFLSSRFMFEFLIEKEVKNGTEIGKAFSRSSRGVELLVRDINSKKGIKYKVGKYNSNIGNIERIMYKELSAFRLEQSRRNRRSIGRQGFKRLVININRSFAFTSINKSRYSYKRLRPRGSPKIISSRDSC